MEAFLEASSKRETSSSKTLESAPPEKAVIIVNGREGSFSKSWLQKFGSDKIILGADAHNEKIAVSGLLEESDQELIPFVKVYQKEGVSYVICTDISKDGMLEGPSFDLYKKMLSEIEGIKLIASGGISTFDELPKLAELGCEGTIIGKAIYENKISLKQLENYILETT